MSGNEGKMEGWLYMIRNNRIGLQYLRKRYFVLEDTCLKSFKSIPKSQTEEPVRRAIIDSYIRVVDNGKRNHNRRLFFIFTLCNTCNHKDQLKLGATSSEEAVRWIRSLQNAAANPGNSLIPCSKRKYQPVRLSISKRTLKRFSDWSSASSVHVDAMTFDVIGPSTWKIFACQNGLRLFKEVKDIDSNVTNRDDCPAIMAVGVIEGASEVVFQTLMSVDSSRAEWDFCFSKGSVVEQLDSQTDIIHIKLYKHWLPWAMKRRDMLLQRNWRREDDGTYVILYNSVVNKNCPPQNGYVRACIKSGGHVITPIKNGKACVVKNMLSVDWKFWKSYVRKASSRSITIHMLGNIAALRELFRARAENSSTELLPEELDIGILDCERQDEALDQLSENSSLTGPKDTVDEFYDLPEPSDDLLENGMLSNTSPESCYVNRYQMKTSSAADFVKKLQDYTVHKKGYVDLQAISWEENVSCCYGATLPEGTTLNMPCSWFVADPSSFLLRGENYLQDRKKIKAKDTLMQMVGADWLQSDKREEDLSGRYGGIVQDYAAKERPEFFFVINIQVPGSTTYSLALYYMLKNPLKESPLLEHFVNGDDAFRNSRFKLIPHVCKGSWIVKQSVGKKACLIGQALTMNYFRGKNYLEIGVDIGSSTVARGVVGLVLGYLNNLVVEMAFVIQGNTPEELPEVLLGTCRFNHLDVSKAVSTDSIGKTAFDNPS